MAGELGNDRMDVTADEPGLQLEGTEAGAGNLSLKEDTGALTVFDETNSATLFSVVANQEVAVEIPVRAFFEKSPGDLPADSVGIKYETQVIKPTWLKNSAKAAIEASWTASDAASETAIELHDVTKNVIAVGVSGNEGTDAKSGYVDLPEGHIFKARVRVTAKGGSGATTACQKAVVYMRVSFA